ncbi:hypothetical protein [Oligella sp. HMSC09E12]|uniref:hypothetical protein n=1 Tax=Oligella sp. HMSC09E12 TaxID=1581147 RepID=UPI0008A1CE7B|nr:hypothetical protein [Oligella sp. HMSC09E12]OFV49720.1 hypothetical protein HMPREF3179_03675 [Oligella sp. HMSC09E12]
MNIDALTGTTQSNKTLYKLYGQLPTERLENLIENEELGVEVLQESEHFVSETLDLCRIAESKDRDFGLDQIPQILENLTDAVAEIQSVNPDIKKIEKILTETQKEAGYLEMRLERITYEYSELLNAMDRLSGGGSDLLRAFETITYGS